MYDCYLLLAISLPNIIYLGRPSTTAVSFLLTTVCQAICHVQVLHNASRMGWFGSRVILANEKNLACAYFDIEQYPSTSKL